MKPTIRTWLALAIAFFGLYMALPDCGLAQDDQGQNDRGRGFKLGVPNGSYAFQDSGFVTDPSGLVLIHVAGQETFFANGTVTGVASFSVGPSGTVFKRVTFAGTFMANGDGSFSETTTNSLGVPVNLDVYPTPDGNTLTFVETDTGTILSGFATRGR